MNSRLLIKIAGGTAIVLGAIVLAGILNTSPRVQAQNDEGINGDKDEASLIRIGFAIAPVPLNLEGKNRALVGLGSFIVNAQADCDGCHTSGGPPNFNYANGKNPYFIGGKPGRIDPTTYLSGGTDFGPAVPPSAAVGGFPPGSIPPSYPPEEYGSYVGPDIVSRNLTPDKTGRPEGGHTLEQFKEIMRHGTDFDHLHPTCTSATPTPTPANCIPPPVNGNVLQVMPWPVFRNMTDHQLEAIYEYLSAIPCLVGPPNVQQNDCGDPPAGQQSALDHADARVKTARTKEIGRERID